MASKVRAHIRSNIVAYIALFFALSGVAVAAPQFIRSGDPAGGDLTGTYPNPTIKNDAVGINETTPAAEDEITDDGVDAQDLFPFGGAGASGTTAPPSTSRQCFLGEVFLTAASFAPNGTQPADGRLLLIADFVALFSLLGSTYGGDGTTNFALPDLRQLEPRSSGGAGNPAVHYVMCTNGVFPTTS